jgi:hypothetical protein
MWREGDEGSVAKLPRELIDIARMMGMTNVAEDSFIDL